MDELLAEIDSLIAQLRDDPYAAATRIEKTAQTGDVDAQALIAQMYAEGKGVVQNKELGFHWYSIAANNGHVESMNMVGRCYDLGHGVAANDELAVVWYRRAAEHGLDWGLYNYANFLTTGRGIRQDHPLAFTLYLQAAEKGHAKSMNLVGRYLEEGLASATDRDAAIDWYRKSAHAGDFRGQTSYAAVLAESGRIDEAEHWLKLALKHGSPSFLAHMRNTLPQVPYSRLRALLTEISGRTE
ncbi:MAG: sel1 repeat family protein [Xanthomonadaceae bacterium]|nr:sel1 repeat family protein [Xanthomonadaceae bacterium]